MTERVDEIVAALHPGQGLIYNSPARFKVVAAGRRFGKSHLAAVLCVQEAMRTENDKGYELTQEHGVYYVAPTFDQAKRAVWNKIRRIAGYYGKRSKWHPDGGLILNENVNDGWVEFINRRRIYIKGSEEPDRLRGSAMSFVVLDEYADMKPETWDDIVEPALMDVEGGALFIGTPKGKNHFWRLFMGAWEKPADERTGSSAHWNDWAAFHFKSTDNPYLKTRELERIMNDPRKTKEMIRQELQASFISGGSKYLKSSDFEIIERIPRDVIGNIYVTVDIAGFKKQERGKKLIKDDWNAIGVTLVDRENWYVLNMKYGHWTPRQVALEIMTSLREHPGARLGIEKGALMNAVLEPLTEYMREFGRYVTPEPLSHGNTHKPDRILWALQGRSQRKLIKLVKGSWNDWLLDQIDDFPDTLAKDDGPDALAYVDQMASAIYVEPGDIQEPEILDPDTGY